MSYANPIKQPRISEMQDCGDPGDTIHVLALVKGKGPDAQRFVWLYTAANRTEVLHRLAQYASNPEIPFTWYDAAVLSQKIRQTFSDEYDGN